MIIGFVVIPTGLLIIPENTKWVEGDVYGRKKDDTQNQNAGYKNQIGIWF
jgi:hypothetical protein